MDNGFPINLHDRRLIRAALLPLAERIGEERSAAVRADVMHRSGRPGGEARAIDLLNRVEALESDFEKAVYELPAKLRQDGRVVDVRRALEQLKATVEALDVGA